ncbi:MAG TPA: hypothetical protein VEQ18_03750 [Candidatus Nitrosocosmicus sp.]|nr:hypothetical protein [Candidatus Nitrosocosmicus sp.]
MAPKIRNSLIDHSQSYHFSVNSFLLSFLLNLFLEPMMILIEFSLLFTVVWELDDHELDQLDRRYETEREKKKLNSEQEKRKTRKKSNRLY